MVGKIVVERWPCAPSDLRAVRVEEVARLHREKNHQDDGVKGCGAVRPRSGLCGPIRWCNRRECGRMQQSTTKCDKMQQPRGDAKRSHRDRACSALQRVERSVQDGRQWAIPAPHPGPLPRVRGRGGKGAALCNVDRSVQNEPTVNLGSRSILLFHRAPRCAPW
jgi:hypothetical protein